MTEYLSFVLKASVILFMLGSLGGMGLELALREAIAAMRNVRFVALTLLLCFLFCPALAYLLTRVMPLQQPYAMGLLLLGQTPSAPFMPLVVRKAHGDLAYTAAFMLLAAFGTVVFMPISAPLLISGLTAGAWVVAKPLVFFVLVPLLVGITIRTLNAGLATRLCSIVKPGTNLVAVVMLLVLAILYGKGFVGLVGTYAIAAQVVFIALATCVAFWLSTGLEDEQRSVLSIGICTRNIGAAFAPLVAINADPRAIVMVAFAVPVTVLGSFCAARWLARRATRRSVQRPKSDAVGAR